MSVETFDGPIVGLWDAQGVITPGSGEETWKRFERAKKTIEIGSEAIGVDIKRVCFEKGDLYFLIQHAQIAQAITAALSIADFRAWCDCTERRPDYMTGLSVGLWSQLSANGMVEGIDEDEQDFKVIQLLAKRGQIVHQFNQENDEIGESGAMAALLGQARARLANLLPESLVVGVSRPTHDILSGPTKVLKRFAEEHGLSSRELRNLEVVGALHHPLQAPTQGPLRIELEVILKNDPIIKMLGNSEEAGYLLTKDQVINHLIDQLVEEAQWEGTLNRLVLDGVVYAVQYGPDKKRGLLRDAKTAGLIPVDFPVMKAA
jgi:[acyl-carrier-protein] S-malonyltransferase